MKKILMIHTTYRLTGGEDVAFNNEVKVLKNNFNVEVMKFSNKNIPNIFKQFIYFLTNNNKDSQKKLKKKLVKFKPDIVYVHNTWFKASLGIFKELNNSGVDFVIKLHNYRFDCGKSFFKKTHLNGRKKCDGCGYNDKDNFFFNKYFKESYIKSLFLIIYSKKYYKLLKESKIVTLSEFQKNFLVESGFEPKLINTLHNPISIGKISKNFNYYDLEPKSYIIYAGLISEAKGSKTLIETYSLLKNFKKKLVIVGEGPLYLELKKKFENKNIIFFGKLDNEEVISLIQNAYSVITNTNLYEGQPTLLFEASKMKINSVYPNNGGISEFFPNNNPFSFKTNSREDLFNKLILLNDSKLVQNQSIKNYEFIEEVYSSESYLNNFEKIIN
jgi:glycosyltransferase involved in cell wall biosynthesis